MKSNFFLSSPEEDSISSESNIHAPPTRAIESISHEWRHCVFSLTRSIDYLRYASS